MILSISYFSISTEIRYIESDKIENKDVYYRQVNESRYNKNKKTKLPLKWRNLFSTLKVEGIISELRNFVTN